LFIVSKNHAFTAFKHLAKVLESENNCHISSIKSDHGGEFENEGFENFCNKHGIKHNFSTPRTPHQNGVVERKNRSLDELARTLLHDSNLPKYFWVGVVNIVCYVLNRALIRLILKKTPYELYKGRKPNISHFKVFGCKCFVFYNSKDNIGKFDAKVDDGIFIGYSSHSHAYKIYNKRTMTVEESVHVVFDESNLDLLDMYKNKPEKKENSSELLQRNSQSVQNVSDKESNEDAEAPSHEEVPPAPTSSVDLPREWRTPKNLSLDNIIGQIKQGVFTRSTFNNFFENMVFVSQIEPTSIDIALSGDK